MSTNRTETANPVAMKRPHGFYISDNEVVDKLACEIGIFAFGVYHMLLRKAESREGAKVSIREIAKHLAISKDAASAALKTLKSYRLVVEVAATERNEPPMYLIAHGKDVVAEHAQDPQPCPEIRTRIRTTRVRNSGQGVSVIQDAGVPDSGQGCPEIRTSYIEEDKDRKQKQDNTPQPPKGGELKAAVSQRDRSLATPPAKAPAPHTPVSRRERVTRADRQMAKAAIGMYRPDADPAPRRTDGDSIRTLADARNRWTDAMRWLERQMLREDADKAAIADWRDGFCDLRISDFEAVEGSSDAIVLHLVAPDSKRSTSAMRNWDTRVRLMVSEHFPPGTQLSKRIQQEGERSAA